MGKKKLRRLPSDESRLSESQGRSDRRHRPKRGRRDDEEEEGEEDEEEEEGGGRRYYPARTRRNTVGNFDQDLFHTLLRRGGGGAPATAAMHRGMGRARPRHDSNDSAASADDQEEGRGNEPGQQPSPALEAEEHDVAATLLRSAAGPQALSPSVTAASRSAQSASALAEQKQPLKSVISAAMHIVSDDEHPEHRSLEDNLISLNHLNWVQHQLDPPKKKVGDLSPPSPQWPQQKKRDTPVEASQGNESEPPTDLPYSSHSLPEESSEEQLEQQIQRLQQQQRSLREQQMRSQSFSSSSSGGTRSLTASNLPPPEDANPGASSSSSSDTSNFSLDSPLRTAGESDALQALLSVCASTSESNKEFEMSSSPSSVSLSASHLNGQLPSSKSSEVAI
mmetsp:Transcript_20474/g.41937  ORF Transcript_20474/g.41937 Transcript_20474/m.41937 type:complete len:394 (+) Transcript_20474:658-1839(+)